MIVALTNSKGGVGKSTLAVHLAVWLHERGVKTALIDCDVQGASSTWIREVSPDMPVFRLQTPDEILDQIPQLHRQCGNLVVDGPAGLSEVTRSILLVADLALLPCGPSVLDLRAITEAIRVVMQAQVIRNGPPRATIIPNKLQSRYRLSRETLETLASLGLACAHPLTLRQAYADAAGQGRTVWKLGARSVAAAREIKELFHGLFR